MLLLNKFSSNSHKGDAMSQWTHVTGCIRVDGLPKIVPGFTIKNIEKVLGPQCTFDDWRDDTNLPCGSEGGLQYRVIEYDDGLPWVVIPVWGDLRDYDNVNEIRQWWKNTLAQFKIVRAACLVVEVEYGERFVLTEKDVAVAAPTNEQ